MSFSQEDLMDMRSFTIKEFSALPGRCRLPGMSRDLTVEEKSTMAHYLAAVTIMNRKGAIKEGTDPRKYLALAEQIVNPEPLDSFESSTPVPGKPKP